MISILIPVFNEEEILRTSALKVQAYLSTLSLEHEVIIISNGSTDRTEQIGRQLEQEFNWLRFFALPEKGVGLAFVTGVREAKGNYLVSLDIDLSSDMRFIEYAIDLLRHADMVVGSKTMGTQRRSFLRVIASQTYILFAQLLFDLTISDYSIGCKAYRREAILAALPHLDSWTGYVFELCVFLRQKGAKIIQVGVDCDDRRKSHFILLHEGFYRYYHLIRTWYKLRSKDSWFVGK